MVDREELTVDTAPGIIKDVQDVKKDDIENYQSNYPDADIVYVVGEGYKIVVHDPPYQYYMDLPDDYVLQDITNIPKRDIPKDDDIEAGHRETMGIPELSKDAYDSGFLDEYTVPVPVGILDLEKGSDYKELASRFNEAVENNRSRITSTLMNDPEYVGLLTAEMYASGGDVNTAITNLEATDAYGRVLKRLNLKQSQIDNERLEFTDNLQWKENYSNFVSYFKDLSVSSYGVELPDEIANGMADLVNTGYFTVDSANRQLNAILDNQSNVEIDSKVLNILEGQTVTQTVYGEQRVRDLMDTYLPDSLHNSIDYDVKKLAGDLRRAGVNSKDAENAMIAKMKKTRFQFYDMYDEDIPWATILSSKQSSAKNILGVDLSSNDPLLDEIIKMNDVSKEQQKLREYGLSNGMQKTKNDLALSIMQSFGTGVVPQQSFRG
mgnify:CR=1 FL=1|tara:strand:+ start:10457 stop:11764 length:1308 start_codon:yes stop_codon:yes gene_type:complete